MKKRFLSIFTAIIMVCSFVGVMPKLEMKVEAAAYTWPVSTNYPVTCGFYGYDNHGGVDMAVPLGTPVYATAAGTATVIDRGCLGSHYGGKPACSNGLSCGAYKNGSTYGSYGNHIKIDHGGGVITYYCHLSTGIPISNGKSVQQGELIGYSGTSGKSTGPHLHFEIRINGSRKNPADYLTKINVNSVPPKPINTPIDTTYKTPIGNVTPKNTSGLTLVYNVYGVPYNTSVRNIAPTDVCTINEVYATGFCKITYPTSNGTHTEYAKTADFNIRPIDERFAPYMPLTAYLCNNATAYVSTGEIWATDKCTIKAVYTDGTCDVTYPTSKGDKDVRTSLSYFIPNTSANFEKVTASKQIYAYSRTDRAVNIGYTDPGDACVKIATSGDQVQIIYPIPGGHKLGFVYASELPHNHSFGSWLTTLNATCTANGSKQRKCSICGHTETQTINKLGHSLGNWTTKNATCTATGSKTRNCSRCEYSEVQTIAKVPHKYTSKVVAATCKDKGYTQYTCSVCKNTYKDTYTNITTSHKWGNWTTSKNATCITDGSKARKCSVCGKSETQTIAKFGHSMSDWTTKNATCTADGSKTRSCTRNGCTHKETQTITKIGHKYTSKVIAPTCTVKGYTEYTCSACKHTYTDAEKVALGHKFTSKIENGTTTYTCSACKLTYKVTFEGKGTSDSPYLIANKDDLFCLASLINNTNTVSLFRTKCYKQTANIDLKNENWTPMGIFKVNGKDSICHFDKGFVYDGNNHNIYNMNVNETSGYTGFIGKLNFGTIKNLSVYGNISTTDSRVGGIVGELGYMGTIEKCSFNGNVKGNSLVGGIVGHIWRGGNVINCYHNGTVTAENSAGGIVGHIQYGDYKTELHTNINNCYHAGDISGAIVGGIAGRYTEYGTLNENNTVNINNSYFLNSSAEKGIGEGSITKNNSSSVDLNTLKALYDKLGSAFAENSHSNLNNGYPVFEWQLEASSHKYTSKVVAPTCTAKGYTLYTCECGDSYKDNYTDMIPHKNTAKEVVEPTCKKEGYTVYKCSSCGAERKDDYVKPTGHKYESEEFNPGNGREPFTLFTCVHCKGSYKDTVSKKHKGDFDKDGTLKVVDAVFMKKILTKSHKPTSEEIMIADVNQDGTVNVFDMIIMKRTLMNSK